MTKKITALSMLTAFALVCSIIEDRFPLPINLPGVKLGLANIFIFSVIILFGFSEALLVVFVRVVMNAMFGITPAAILYSLPAGLVSSTIMFLLYKCASKQFSIVSISICSSVMHILTQLTIAYLILKESLIFSLLPILLLSAIVTGLFVGISTNHLSIRLKKLLYTRH